MFRTRFEKEIVAELGALCVGVSFAPTELVPAGPLSPTACAPSTGSGQAVGCILPPLRGSSTVVRSFEVVLVLGPAQDVIAISSRDQDLNRLFDFAQGRLSRKGREKWGHPALYLIPFITRTSSLLS
jgi:hypothetical protein